MIHIFLIWFGIYWVGVGVVICVKLISVNIKAKMGLWLVTIPGMLIVAILGIDFVCHIIHLPRHAIPYQTQIVNIINWALRIAALPLLLIKLYDLWLKKRAPTISPPSPSG